MLEEDRVPVVVRHYGRSEIASNAVVHLHFVNISVMVYHLCHDSCRVLSIVRLVFIAEMENGYIRLNVLSELLLLAQESFAIVGPDRLHLV